MTPEQFKQKGCYTCGSYKLEEPRIAVDSDNLPPINNPKSVMYNPEAPVTGTPVREPYLRCVECTTEYPFELISQLDDEGWQYGWDNRHGDRAIPTTVYKSEAQFDPDVMAKGFMTKEEEDVARPG